ncbi:MAG: phosphoribosylformylglycinamidine synthase subunit PurL [Candidatus ainarchaeum sp.]|nr:phosphoribosylformylglycinamidine synthase subunit PurL [Candidatus ainarchaeum sp.]MDD5096192.1 phosphoribosylformylglycinamidine synthase subunit PurL [Candidatus ainarchaeum sp.]
MGGDACRIEVRPTGNLRDPEAASLARQISELAGVRPSDVAIVRAYNIYGGLSDEEMERLGRELFADAVSEEFSFKEPFYPDYWRIEVGFLPGMTDNEGNTAREGIRDVLGKEVEAYASRVYAIKADFEDDAVLAEIAKKLLANEVIQAWKVYEPESGGFEPYVPRVELDHAPVAKEIELQVPDEELMKISRERTLALSLEEMREIKAHFAKAAVRKEREGVGLGRGATDVELEALAQSWSEHCKHKIFNARIDYSEEGDGVEGKEEKVDSIFKTYIRSATDEVRKPYVVSVFKDNGGIIRFDHENDIAVKVETHNAPSALDPYGGALTGILGVNRDVLGTGMGAKPIANVNMLCFGFLDGKDVPKGCLHPRRIAKGVVRGIEHGGNMVGIPTVNGSVVFEQCYTTRPLVYAGTVGLMPHAIGGRETARKEIKPGHLAVMVGGRIGKDGIHGATFSSQQLTTGIVGSVVQIGDPITQKKVIDMVLEARDLGLFEAVTDNGAGGLSSSIGELAQLSGGCEVHLEKCPLKYPGLDPWEILLSESQERMTLAVPAEKMPEIEKLARKHGVEASVVGTFTDSGRFHILFGKSTVAYIDMQFLHEGVPQMHLKAVWKDRMPIPPNKPLMQHGDALRALLASPNIASKEWVIRQYDHEVQGGSALKPLMEGNAPSDGGVIRPLLGRNEGLAVAHGLCPRYMEDAYHMAMNAVDEGVRNAVACGAKFGYLACLDNFCWPDPIKGPRNPDGDFKLAQLVRAARGMHDAVVGYGIPIISGKDSMKNDYHAGDSKHSINPTLLVTVVGKVEDVTKIASSDFKEVGDAIYVLGTTRHEMGGSEYFKLHGGTGAGMPRVRVKENSELYAALSKAIERGMVRSVHDVSDGGLACAFAECAMGGEVGAEMDLSLISKDTDEDAALLFSESAGRFVVSVREKDAFKFEKMMFGTKTKKAGRVRGDKRVVLRNGNNALVNEDVFDLREAWAGGLKW